MHTYLRELPRRDLAARRRFVIVATAISFGVIIIVWFILGAVGRFFRGTRVSPVPSVAAPAPAREEPSPTLEDLLAPRLDEPTRAPLHAPSASPEPFVGL